MTMFTIILVEDNESWQNILQLKINHALEKINYTDYKIKVINNFEEAFEALQESSWNLVVTDIGLGNNDMQPQKLGKQIVELAHEKDIPVIVVSGTTHLNVMDVRDILTILGASDFFYKETFDSQEFIKKIQDIAQNQQQLEGDILSTNYDYQLNDDDKQYLITTLSRLAGSATISATEYFKYLVNQLNLPEDWKNSIADIWTGNINADTNKLVNWIEQKKSYPHDSGKSGYTVLGILIEKLLEETGDRHLLDIIIRYQLITDESILETLKNNYL